MELSFINKLKEENKSLFDSVLNLEQGTEILNENDQCNHVLFLISGQIEVYKISKNGRIFRIYTIDPGESCVLNLSCVLSDSSYMAYARAMTDLECVLLPQKEFLRIFQEEEGLRNYVFKLISTRLIQITARVEGIVLDSLENRLMDWLTGQNRKMIYVTHEELANQLGSAREVISRQLKKWEKEGLLKLYRGRIEMIQK